MYLFTFGVGKLDFLCLTYKILTGASTMLDN